MKYENVSDSDIISLFEFRIDYNGYIDKDLYNRYLLAIRKEEEKNVLFKRKNKNSERH